MLALSLLVVFVVAKLGVLIGGPLPFSLITLVAVLWQDAVVVAVFALVERHVKPALAWAAYGLFAMFALGNVPVERALGSPVTATMLRAASRTLSDSMASYLTIGNVGATLAVAVAAVATPLLLRRAAITTSRFLARTTAGAAAVLALAGSLASTRTSTAGVHRNALMALVQSMQPRVNASHRGGEWRAPHPLARGQEDLTALRGSSRGRNVMIVVLESTAAEYLRTFGAREDPMPRLTAFARDAVVFRNAYTVYPESVKGMVAYLASRYPAFDVTAAQHADAVSPSLATELGASGYATALFHSGRFMYLGMDELLAHAGFDKLADAGDIGGDHNSSFGIDEPSAVRAMFTWIDSVPRGKPFAVAYLPIEGHHPYAHSVRGPFPETRDVDRYRNALHEADEAFGSVLDGLKARGLDTSTVIMVFGDHGEAFGQHAGNYAHTLAIYDENVHVPLIVSVPGQGGAIIDRTASLLDVAPTLLDIVGLPAPSTFQGASLLDPVARRALFFTDYSLGLLGVRDGCAKYIYEIESRQSQLFDVCTDQHEVHDLARESAARVGGFRALLAQWSSAQVALVRDVQPTWAAR